MSQNKKQDKTRPFKPSLLEALLARPKKDKEYKADLSAQWNSMDNEKRVKFVAGGIFALFLFIAALIGVYFILNYLGKLIF